MVDVLIRKQWLPATLEAVWAFFSNPENLNEITPPELHFEFVDGAPRAMFAGQIIRYRIRLLPGVRMLWVTEIAHVEPFQYFVDEQRLGPYRFWYHLHRFEPEGDGVWVIDEVTYALPRGAGFLAWWVKRRLRRIFDYRASRIAQLFPPAEEPQTSGREPRNL